MTTYWSMIGIVACACLAFLVLYPWTIYFFLPLCLIFALLLWKAAVQPISDPERAVIFRLEVFHRIADSGYVFLVPTFDRVARIFTIKEEPLDVTVTQFYPAESREKMDCHIELAWRIQDAVKGKVTGNVRQMVFMDGEQRKKLVEQVVISISRQLGSYYTEDQLDDNQVREAFCHKVRQAANELLESWGLTIERLFWRGYVPIRAVQEAKTRGVVQRTEVEAMVKAIQLIQKELGPEVSAEDLYAMYEFIKIRKSGGDNPFIR
ncbi:MAG TPA: SPFH domain-containing protein [Ktedonobacterales bacterium]|jgi:regulator of protease activity HflC (stomatin/prohibitin superfamily)